MPAPLIPISNKQALLFACFLVLYEFLTYIANDMIMPGMIDVVRSFQAPESDVATSLTLYLLGGASLQLILGPLSDSIGRRPVMLFGALLFIVFTVLISFSNSMNQFFIARFFQGMGLCFISVIGYATIQEIFEETDAIRLIALMANAAILAPLLGPLFGAIIIHYTSWRYLFLLIAFLALIAFWGLARFMPEPIGQLKRDGFIIPKVPFSFDTIYGQYKALLANKAFCFSTLAVSVLITPCIAWIGLAPIIFIKEAKLSVIEYGLWQLPVFSATILGNCILFRLTHVFQIKEMIGIGSVMMVLGTLLTALLPYLYGNHYLLLIPGMILYFCALSIISAPLNRLCLFVTDVSKGTASSIVSLFVMVINALGMEAANIIYIQHINLYFGLFCVATNAVYLVFIIFAANTKTLRNNPPCEAARG